MEGLRRHTEYGEASYRIAQEGGSLNQTSGGHVGVDLGVRMPPVDVTCGTRKSLDVGKYILDGPRLWEHSFEFSYADEMPSGQ